jgi:hypothetical protein
MIRFGFSIRTKSGQRVDNIQIMAATPIDAERRLRQMYQQCEIVDRREQTVARRIDLRADATAASQAGASASGRKSGTQ